MRTTNATKTCTGCRCEMPATTEFFPRRKATKKDGLAYRCHECNRAAVAACEAKR